MRLRLGAEKDDGPAGGERAGAERDQECFAVPFAGARVELDRLAGLVTADTEDCMTPFGKNVSFPPLPPGGA